MSVETSTEANRSPGVIPAAPWRICALRLLPGYRSSLTFVDGVQGIADLSRLVRSENAGRFAALAEPALFSRATFELLRGAGLFDSVDTESHISVAAPPRTASNLIPAGQIRSR